MIACGIGLHVCPLQHNNKANQIRWQGRQLKVGFQVREERQRNIRRSGF